MKTATEFISHQYSLIQSSRTEVFRFCETFQPGDYTKSITFDGKSISNIQVHTANTYQGWILTIARKLQAERYKDTEYQSLELVKKLFQEIDTMVFNFIHDSQHIWLEPFQAEIKGKRHALTRAHIFTHVITHEFHHKGQVLMLARQMGYVPPDTDIIRV